MATTDNEQTAGPASERSTDGTEIDPFRAEQLARIGVLIGAQRVEIYRRSSAGPVGNDGDVEYQLLGWWAALDTDPAPAFEPDAAIPARWFPWSVGNLRPAEYLLVTNAGALAVHPSGHPTIAELGLESCLHVPIRGDHGELLGAACAYWNRETESVPDELRNKISELARASLDHHLGAPPRATSPDRAQSRRRR